MLRLRQGCRCISSSASSSLARKARLPRVLQSNYLLNPQSQFLCPSSKCLTSLSQRSYFSSSKSESDDGDSKSTSKQKVVDPAVALEKAERCARYGAYSDIVLAISKGVVGAAAHSPALIADAFHSLADVGADVVAIFSLKEARKPADWDHPFGHGKFESWGAAAIGGVLMSTGAALAVTNMNLISDLLTIGPEVASTSLEVIANDLPLSAAIATAAGCLVVKEALFRWTLAVAKEAKSPSMEANAQHHRSDALSSAVVLVGVGGTMLLDTAWLDPTAGLLVSFMITHAGWDCIKDASGDLLDRTVSPEVLASLTTVVSGVPGVRLAGWAPVRAKMSGPNVRNNPKHTPETHILTHHYHLF